MMAGIPAVLFLVQRQQREIHHPQKIEAARIDHQLAARFQNIGAINADFAQDFAGGQPLVGGKENQVAFLDFEFGGQGG